MATHDTNPSFVLLEPGKVAYEDRPVPELRKADDVLVRVMKTGICGSDVHYYTQGRIGSFVVREPMVLGHESSGVVVETGAGVTTLKPGDRVALEPGVPCRTCARCKEGRYNLCAAMAFAATPPHDGTLARYFVLPADLCYKLPDHVSLEEGALVEPLAVGVHLCRTGGVQAGTSVVVFGAGPIGLLACAVARAFGARTVVAVDILPARLAFARSYAATHTFAPTPTSTPSQNASTLRSTPGLDLLDGADIVLEASGAPPSIETGIHCLRRGGTFVQAGLGAPTATFPIADLCVNEICARGSFRYGPGDYAAAVALLAAGAVRVRELVTRRVRFRDAEDAFRAFGTEHGGIKTVVGGVDE